LLRFERGIRGLSSYTFTLYLVHALVMSLWLALVRHDRDSAVDIAALTVLIVAATWVVGQLTEQRKHWFSVGFERLAGWVRPVGVEARF